MKRKTFAKQGPDGRIERGEISDKLFPTVIEVPEASLRVHSNWLSDAIIEAVESPDLIDKVRDGDPDAWRQYAEWAFRQQGMPAVFAKYANPGDKFLAKSVSDEFEKGLSHKDLEANSRDMRFRMYQRLIGFALIGEERENFLRDLQVAGEEMTQFGATILKTIQDQQPKGPAPIVSEDSFVIPETILIKQR